MKFRLIGYVFVMLCIAALAGAILLEISPAADHNDPNGVNSIFSDIDVSAADLYDIFGFPADDRTNIEKVVIALTFAAVPHTGVFDTDMLYRILIAPDRRIARTANDDTSLAGLLAYIEAVKEKYLKILRPSE